MRGSLSLVVHERPLGRRDHRVVRQRSWCWLLRAGCAEAAAASSSASRHHVQRPRRLVRRDLSGRVPERPMGRREHVRWWTRRRLLSRPVDHVPDALASVAELLPERHDEAAHRRRRLHAWIRLHPEPQRVRSRRRSVRRFVAIFVRERTVGRRDDAFMRRRHRCGLLHPVGLDAITHSHVRS